MHLQQAFTEIAIILLGAVLIGAAGAKLRQPLIVSFIAVGVLAGPAGFSLITQHEEIELLASVGISLLLFVVGLKLDFQTIRTLGRVALATGVGQIVFTSVVGYFIAIALGMEPLTATYVAVALTFSSTIIIVKLLSDKHEIDALHGRIAVGFLIVQDIAVILVMIGITALGAERTADQSLLAHAGFIGLKGLLFLGVIAALSLRGLPSLATFLARSPELLVLSGIAWAVALSAVAEALGFSKEVGAFLAGTSLASTPYREAIGSRLVTVRDFLLLFFFIDLGARLDLTLMGETFGLAMIFSAFVLIGNPVIVMAIMGFMGYRKRTSFLAGLTVAQISEFSLILAALGLSVGHINAETMSLITSVGLVTIGLSSYMILFSAPLYERLSPWLSVFERRTPFREIAVDTPSLPQADVVVFGLGRYGSGIVRHLISRNRRVIGVDFDPQALEHWRAQGLPVVYGDASDPELFDHLPLEGVKWVVSTAPDLDTSRILLNQLRERGFRGKIAVSVRDVSEETTLRLAADVTLRPYADAAEQAADAITASADQISVLAGAVPDLREIRLGTASRWVGRNIADVPLRDEFRVTVLAVSRGGRNFFNPGPDFQLFPGDRLIISGEPTALDGAAEYLSQVDASDHDLQQDDLAVEEVHLKHLPGWIGRTLADLKLRTHFGVSVLAVARGDQPLAAPDPRQPLSSQDRLVLAGTREALHRMQEQAVEKTRTVSNG